MRSIEGMTTFLKLKMKLIQQREIESLSAEMYKCKISTFLQGN
jgi:hypothetical protein